MIDIAQGLRTVEAVKKHRHLASDKAVIRCACHVLRTPERTTLTEHRSVYFRSRTRGWGASKGRSLLAFLGQSGGMVNNMCGQAVNVNDSRAREQLLTDGRVLGAFLPQARPPWRDRGQRDNGRQQRHESPFTIIKAMHPCGIPWVVQHRHRLFSSLLVNSFHWWKTPMYAPQHWTGVGSVPRVRSTTYMVAGYVTLLICRLFGAVVAQLTFYATVERNTAQPSGAFWFVNQKDSRKRMWLYRPRMRMPWSTTIYHSPTPTRMFWHRHSWRIEFLQEEHRTLNMSAFQCVHGKANFFLYVVATRT